MKYKFLILLITVLTLQSCKTSESYHAEYLKDRQSELDAMQTDYEKDDLKKDYEKRVVSYLTGYIDGYNDALKGKE